MGKSESRSNHMLTQFPSSAINTAGHYSKGKDSMQGISFPLRRSVVCSSLSPELGSISLPGSCRPVKHCGAELTALNNMGYS